MCESTLSLMWCTRAFFLTCMHNLAMAHIDCWTKYNCVGCPPTVKLYWHNYSHIYIANCIKITQKLKILSVQTEATIPFIKRSVVCVLIRQNQEWINTLKHLHSLLNSLQESTTSYICMWQHKILHKIWHELVCKERPHGMHGCPFLMECRL